MRKNILVTLSALAVSGCAAKTTVVGSFVLHTSNKSIDVVQHRSDSRECSTGVVVQTFDASGTQIDSKMAEGNAFHCHAFTAWIHAGGIVGAAAVLRPSRTNVRNSNSQSQGQNQEQGQTQTQSQSQPQPAPAGGGNGGGGGQGNNGKGNGGGDGSPNGKDDTGR